ncbi:hypothetical protein CL619_03420 [archaeon]|nr:hypothetical protein [archaeon]|tara:strand:- start:7163 stop:7555 length:393 start_codon:yes stop_codon:yes gene_type:complete
MFENVRNTGLVLLVASSVMVSCAKPSPVIPFNLSADFVVPVANYFDEPKLDDSGRVLEISSIGVSCGYSADEGSWFLAKPEYFIDLSQVPLECNVTDYDLLFNPDKPFCYDWMNEQARLACGGDVKFKIM